jgi:hypothetical protein
MRGIIKECKQRMNNTYEKFVQLFKVPYVPLHLSHKLQRYKIHKNQCVENTLTTNMFV